MSESIIEDTLKAVAGTFGVSVEDLISKSKRDPLTQARHLAVVILMQGHGVFSRAAMGAIRRERSGSTNAHRNIYNRIETDRKFRVIAEDACGKCGIKLEDIL